MYVAFKSINLEPPSDEAQTCATESLQSRITPSDHSQKILTQLKLEAFGAPEETVFKKKKFKKGPNPLSCKPKKKSKLKQTVQDNGVKKKKNRKRSKVKVSKEAIKDL